MESKYAKYKANFVAPPREVDDQALSELEAFDWFNFVSTAPQTAFVPDHISVLNVSQETIRERKLRMLRQLSSTCIACSMCELGLKGAERNGIIRDPHVLSNMNPSMVMVVGQNPGWNELEKREPFVGAAGKNFDDEIGKHGLSRNDFYICNIVRCFTIDNQRPTDRHQQKCSPFLQIEINLIKPRLLVSLGGVAFSYMCPDYLFGESLGKIVKSRFGIPVFAIYHPSPVNFREEHRRKSFETQIKTLCDLVKAMRIKYDQKD